MLNSIGLPLELGLINRNRCVFPAVKLNLASPGLEVPDSVSLVQKTRTKKVRTGAFLCKERAFVGWPVD